jgi:outer membrane immunogenic protein
MHKAAIALATVATVIGTPALAADLAVKAPPAAPPAFSWTGFYIGGNAGYAWGTTTGVDEIATNGLCWFSCNENWTAGTHGFTGGGQVGANWQTGIAVFGVEADAGYLGLKGHAIEPNTDGGTFVNTNGGFFTTVRGRLGASFLPSNTVLVYLTGGYIGADLDSTVGTNAAAPVQLLNVSNTGFQSGWTWGTGVEWAWNNNWSVKVEWLHYEFEHNKTIGGNFAGGGSTVQFFGIDNIGNLVRAGLNYRFNW